MSKIVVHNDIMTDINGVSFDCGHMLYNMSDKSLYVGNGSSLNRIIQDDDKGDIYINNLNTKKIESDKIETKKIDSSKITSDSVETKNLTLNGTNIRDLINIRLNENKSNSTKCDETKYDSLRDRLSYVENGLIKQRNSHEEALSVLRSTFNERIDHKCSELNDELYKTLSQIVDTEMEQKVKDVLRNTLDDVCEKLGNQCDEQLQNMFEEMSDELKDDIDSNFFSAVEKHKSDMEESFDNILSVEVRKTFEKEKDNIVDTISAEVRRTLEKDNKGIEESISAEVRRVLEKEKTDIQNILEIDKINTKVDILAMMEREKADLEEEIMSVFDREKEQINIQLDNLESMLSSELAAKQSNTIVVDNTPEQVDIHPSKTKTKIHNIGNKPVKVVTHGILFDNKFNLYPNESVKLIYKSETDEWIKLGVNVGNYVDTLEHTMKCLDATLYKCYTNKISESGRLLINCIRSTLYVYKRINEFNWLPITEFKLDTDTTVTNLKISRDEKTIVLSSLENNIVIILNLNERNEIIRETTINKNGSEHKSFGYSFAISRNGDTIFMSSIGNVLRYDRDNDTGVYNETIVVELPDKHSTVKEMHLDRLLIMSISTSNNTSLVEINIHDNKFEQLSTINTPPGADNFCVGNNKMLVCGHDTVILYKKSGGLWIEEQEFLVNEQFLTDATISGNDNSIVIVTNSKDIAKGRVTYRDNVSIYNLSVSGIWSLVNEFNIDNNDYSTTVPQLSSNGSTLLLKSGNNMYLYI